MNVKELKEALAELLEDIRKTGIEYEEAEVRNWLMAATLWIWAANRLFSESYPAALKVFNDKEYTVTQVITALDCTGEYDRELNVPAFFKQLVAQDLQNRTAKSRDVADAIARFLVLPAMINGDFTLEEAHVLREITDLLVDHCKYQGLRIDLPANHYRRMITPLNKDSYYSQSKTDIKSSDPNRIEDTPVLRPSSRSSDMNTAEENGPTITLNLNLVPDTSTPQDQFESAGNVSIKKPQDNAADAETLESVLAELNGLVGLDKVKSDVQSLLNFIKICKLRTERSMKTPTVSYHLVFTGNPGTGKTTVARMVAKLYYLMGILPQGQLVETERSGLVAGYLGQTAIKTQKVIQEALGGVLFVDEAYSLANDDDDSYGKEAIETILKAMEDHRDELIVIVAGYDELMHKFIDSNPGLRSRFNKYFQFPDYDGNDLFLIFKRFCDTNGYAMAEDAAPFLREKFDAMYQNREEHFGNARTVRNLFEHAIARQADRLASDPHITDQELMELTVEDILLAMELM